MTPRWVLAVACGAIAVVAAGPGLAHAEAPAQRLMLDQVVVEPALLPGLARLRLHVTAIDINGAIIDIDGDKRWSIQVGGANKRGAILVGQADVAADPLALVVIIETAAEYGEDLGVITTVLGEQLLADLQPSTQVALLPYADGLGTATRLGPAKVAATALAALSAEADPGSPVLLDAVERALGTLRKVKTTPAGQALRKVIVVVSDGRDLTDDRDRTTLLGDRAAREGVRIHTIGFSPSDTRRPLLALGELSRKSLGTFRWVRSRGEQALRDQVERLRAELRDQYVLTLLAPASELASKKIAVKVTVADRELVSNDLKAPPARCSSEPGAEACDAGYCASGRCVVRATAKGGSALGTILRVAAIAGGAIILLGIVGWLMSRRHKVIVPAGSASMPVMAQAPGRPVTTPPAIPASAVPVAGAQLYVLTGPLAGTRIGLRHGFVLGSMVGCDLLADPSASPHHAQIVADDRFGWRVLDLGSSAGTFVNGVRIVDQRLQHGVTIRVGSTDVRFLAQ